TVKETGQGTHIDISMLGASLGIAALQTSEYFGTGTDPKKLGSAHPRNAPYQVFSCKDGYFGMAAGNDDLWHRLCEAIGHENLLEDSRFLNSQLRTKYQVELKNILEGTFQHKPAEQWLDILRVAGVPCAPINNYSDILSDPQVEHMEWVQPISLPNGHQTKTFASPIRFNNRT